MSRLTTNCSRRGAPPDGSPGDRVVLRAVSSLSLTLGVAIVTMVATAGILAAPSIRDCAAEGRGIAACLRDKLVQSPALPHLDEEPALVSEIPATIGWIDAYASEYPVRPSALAELTAPLGALDVGGPELPPRADLGTAVPAPPDGILFATGRGGAAPQLIARVALVEAPEIQIGSGSLGVPTTSTTSVRLSAPPGTLGAGYGGRSTRPAATVALVEPSGKLSALGVVPSSAPSATAILTPRSGTISAQGAEGASTRIDASAAPDVTVLPQPEKPIEILTIGTPRTGADAAGSTSLQPIIREAALATDAPVIAPEPTPAPPQRRFAYNPAFPNVLVLQPPATGADSSIVSLTLD